MTTNHHALSHIRLVILRSTKPMLGARNRILPNPTMLNNNGIQIHGGKLLIMVIDGVQRIYVTTTHLIRSMPITSIKYLIFVKNNGILASLVENNSFYNKGCIKLVEVLKGNQYNGFKTIPINFGAIKPIVLKSNVEILVSFLVMTFFILHIKIL